MAYPSVLGFGARIQNSHFGRAWKPVVREVKVHQIVSASSSGKGC